MSERDVNVTDTERAERPPEPAFVFYVLSFLVPMAGIILGAIYLSKPTAELKKFGKNCLVCGVTPIALYFMCIFMLVLFYVAFFLFYILVIILVLGAAGTGALKSSLAALACFL